MNKLIFILPLLLVAGCTQQSTQLANPSAVYCEEQGYSYVIRDGEGGQAGYCIFDDGSECPGWDYYNGDCAPGVVNESLVTSEVELNSFTASSPVAVFNSTIIEELGVNCSGTDEVIAECIYDWQASNMIFTQTNPEKGPFNQPYPIRWQEILPGIYTSLDVIEQQVTSSGELYGICFDFATVYCSIAEYYGLDCRIMETAFNVNNETRPGGMSPNEYEVLTPYMIRAGVNYTYEAVRLTMPDESGVVGHYWAEVKLSEPSSFDDNGWRVMDASNQMYNGRSMTMAHISNGTFKVTNWTSKDRSALLENYTLMELSGVDLTSYNPDNLTSQQTFEEGREFFEDDVAAGRAEEYVGITDDLGNENRAAVIADFMQGKALAPYYESCSDVCAFFSGTIPDCESVCLEDLEFYTCYESCSGDSFFKACDFVCSEFDESPNEYASCYESCSGASLNNDCNNEC